MPTLFILEQAENYQQFFSKLLADRYEIKSFNDFQAIEKEITSADLLLLDVEMIDDGQLQQNLHSLKEISNLTRNDFICTLLVTSKEELSVKQQNVLFEYCDDFISMMSNDRSITGKIERFIQRKTQSDEIKKSLLDTGNLVQSCLQLSADLGAIFHFSQKYTSFKNLDDFIEGLLEIISTYHVNVIIRLKTCADVVYASNLGRITELDKQIMDDKLSGQLSGQRFIEFGVRVQINFPRVSILVKNMPKKDNYQSSRIKDNLIYLLSVADNLLSLYESLKLKESLLKEINHSVEVAENMSKQLYSSHTTVMNDLNLNLEEAYLSLGLSEHEADILTELVMSADDTTANLFELSNVSNKILMELREKIVKSYQ